MGFEDVKGLHNIQETRNFSHRFFDNLDNQKISFDNFVIDISTSYSISRGRKYISDLFRENNSFEDAIRIVGNEKFERRDDTDRILSFKSTPYSRLKALEKLEGNFFHPDITKNCLESSSRPMNDVEGLLQYLNSFSEPLPVKDIMGVEIYESVELGGVEISEDEALIRACGTLEGETLVLTYDEDFVDYDIDASVPELFYAASVS